MFLSVAKEGKNKGQEMH